MELISIIIPVYNCADFIDACLESLSAQSYPLWEAILVEDCSTDGVTPTKCDEWGRRDSRIHVIHQPVNGGVSVARNEALRRASGSLLTFVDGDDLLAPDHLKLLYEALTSADADVAITGYSEGEPHSDKQKVCPMLSAGVYKQPSLFVYTIYDREITSHLWNKLYRRNLWEGIIFPEGMLFEDFSVFPKVMARATRLVSTGQSTYRYIRTPGSITKTPSLKQRRDVIFACADRLEELQRFSFLPDAYKAELAIWLQKKMLSWRRRVVRTPQSEERTQTLEAVDRLFARLHLPSIRGAFLLQILCFACRKKRFRRDFEKRFGTGRIP